MTKQYSKRMANGLYLVLGQEEDTETLRALRLDNTGRVYIAPGVAGGPSAIVQLTDGAVLYDARLQLAATYGAPAPVVVGVASGVVIAANAARRMAVIVNDSANVVYLAIGAPAVLNSGIRLNPLGGVAQFGGDGGLLLTTQAINGIATGAGSNVGIQEAT